MKKIFRLISQTFTDFFAADVFSKAAAISYYTIFSLPPMLLVVLYVSALLYSEQEIESALHDQISGLAGRDSANQIIGSIERLQAFDGPWFARVISIGVLIFTSTTIFATMQTALNNVFKVEAKPSTGWGVWAVVKERLLSFSLVLGVAFILVVSLSLNAVVTAFGDLIARKIPGVSVFFLQIMSLVLPLIVTTGLFAITFKLLPDAKLRWRDTLLGAFITACLFAVGKLGIGFYIGNSETANLYETAGAVMVIMLWVYYASVIILFGATLTAAYTKTYNENGIEASDFAVRVREKKIELPKKNPEDKI